jgi:hypothetical protein
MFKMSIFLLLLLLTVLFLGCSSSKYLENEIKIGTIRFFGGVEKNKKWDEKLNLTRVSWYYRLTLYYDVNIYRATKASNFYNWFSPEEKEYFNTCSDLLVSVVYSADSKKISHSMFINQMEVNGYDFITVNSFAKNLRSHPSFEDWKLHRYKIFGHCLKKNAKVSHELTLNFPSFREVKFSP